MLLAGIVLVLLNVAALSPLATGAVEDAVEDTFASYTKDTICANDDCTEAEEEWASSTAQRDYYAWDITNLAEVMAGEEPPSPKRSVPSPTTSPPLAPSTTTMRLLVNSPTTP